MKENGGSIGTQRCEDESRRGGVCRELGWVIEKKDPYKGEYCGGSWPFEEREASRKKG